jgi:hypothetical protein
VPNVNELLLVLALSLVAGGCAVVEEVPRMTPDPIGDELLRIVGAWSNCSGGVHLYREGRQIQSQCFDSNDEFVYENRATLTPDAEAALDAEIAAADLTDTTPVNYKGFCGVADAVGTVTLWVDEQTISFDQNCLIEGIVPLYEHVEAIWSELSECGEEFPELLDSIEPGCRAY